MIKLFFFLKLKLSSISEKIRQFLGPKPLDLIFDIFLGLFIFLVFKINTTVRELEQELDTLKIRQALQEHFA